MHKSSCNENIMTIKMYPHHEHTDKTYRFKTVPQSYGCCRAEQKTQDRLNVLPLHRIGFIPSSGFHLTLKCTATDPVIHISIKVHVCQETLQLYVSAKEHCGLLLTFRVLV